AYGYSAYGTADSALTRGDTDPVNPINPYRYSAKRMDPGSGTLDTGERRFDSGTAKFLQQDLYHDGLADLNLTIDALSENRYSLAGGNPLSFIESDGHSVIPDGGGFAAKSATPGAPPAEGAPVRTRGQLACLNDPAACVATMPTFPPGAGSPLHR